MLNIFQHRQGFLIVQSKSIQLKVPPKTFEKLAEFTRSEGFVSPSDKPIVAHAVFKMIRFFLDTENDPELEKLREKSGGNTFGMVDSAVIEYIKKRQRGNY